MDCAKNIAVVGHGHRRHAQFVDALHKFLNVAGAVEQRIITMQMKMDELILSHEDGTQLSALKNWPHEWFG
jgi:hypothetical protein